MCSTTLWARNVSSRWSGCARGTALSTAFAPPPNWTRIAPALTPPGRRLRRVTSAPTTLATSSRTSAGSSSGWVPWFMLSSQIQCLNTLAPMVDRPDLLSAWLGQHLPVAEGLPFGAITDSPYDESDQVVFEWYGTIDHLGQSVARRC